jgi:hypothetical protein
VALQEAWVPETGMMLGILAWMKLVHSNVHVQVFTFTGGPPPNWLERYSWYAPVQVSPADTMPVRGFISPSHSHEHVSYAI